jgi:hypothetical protein
MADHWHYSGDETAKVAWTREGGPAGGYAQKLVCISFTGHAPYSHVMLAQEDSFALRKGQWYRISFQARGEVPSGAVSIAISQTGPWENVGLHDVFRVGPEWRQHRFFFRANRDISKNLRLQIWYTDTGTLSVSDVELVEVEGPSAPQRYAEVLPDLGSKNLVPNSSFECGASGWGTTSRGVDWGGGGLSTLFGRVDGEIAARHQHSFRIDLDRETAPVLAFDYFEASHFPVLMPLLANRGWISVKPGEDYTFSAYVRADTEGAPCALVVYQAFHGSLRHDAKASREWQRVAYTFKPEGDQIYVGIGPDLSRSDLPRVTLWIDAVQLERGAQASEYQPRAPVEVGLEWERPGHLFESAEEAKATISAFNASEREQSVEVSAAVTDFFDRTAAEPRARLRLPAGGSACETLRLGVRDKGFYRLKLKSSGGAVIPVSAERFGVIAFCRDAEGIFGMNHAYPSAQLLRVSKDFGLTWYRDWSLKWQHVEPEKGRFSFGEGDYQIDRVRKEGLNVLGLLPFPSSEWSSTAPADLGASHDLGEHARMAYKPRDLGEFADYVRATVRHYSGRIRVWEILNEPLYTGYAVPARAGHTIEDYVALLKTAYQAVKEADPKGFVVGGIAADPETMTKELIAAGGLNWLDAINIHIYPVLRAPETYLPQLANLNSMLAEAGQQKPIYFTEGAYYGDDDLAVEPYLAGDALLKPLDSELECASYQARFDILLLSQNVRKIIYHSGTPGSLNRASVDGIFFEWDGAPRKMAISQSAMTALLGPDPKYLGVIWERPSGEGPRSFAFQGRDHTVVAVWDDRNRGHHLTSRPGARVLDLVGASVREKRVALNGTPYYIVIDGKVTLEGARALLSGWLD